MAELYDIMYLGDSKIKYFALGDNLVAPNPYFYQAPINATGGIVSTALIDGLNYKIHRFTSSADFVVSSGGGSVDWLIVAGGAGGGSNNFSADARGGAGGGGAGGAQTGSLSVSPQTYSVVVGAGGAGAPANSSSPGSNGGNSSFGGTTSTGGGGGASALGRVGQNGGSGGGGAADGSVLRAGGTGTAGQGKNGGDGGVWGTRPAGGGGGGAAVAGVAGQNGAGDAGNGGNGLQVNYTGTLTYYAGGGGGSTWQAISGDTPGLGGLGGGGNGCSGSSGTAVAGTDYLGGGGGGGGRYIAGGDGGDGVVIIKYQADYDTASTAFFNATGITDDTTKQAINNLVIQLKLNGIWDECDAIYPFVGGTADTNKYNLKNTSTYTITFGGGWTHNSNGITGNGTNTYADTGWNPTTVGRNTNGHMAVYSRTNFDSTAPTLMSDMGAGSFPNESLMALSNAATTYWIWSGQVQSAAYGNTQGFYVTTRDASNTIGYKNGSLVSSGGNTNNHPNANMYIGAQNTTAAGTRWTSRNYAFASLGSDITDNTTYYNIVQAFQTALGRQV